MAHTIVEKILARAAGREAVEPGDIIEAEVDLALANDITAPIGIAEFEKAGFTKVFDPAKIALVADHFTPNKDIKAAAQSKILREFARRHHIEHFWEVGRVGIEHVLLPDQGLIAPGDVVIGADSHTCTYGALGAFSTGVGSTDFAAAMAWGRVWLRVPETIRFVYHNRPPRYVGGKDLMLHTIGLIGVDGALYQAMEFTGPAIKRMSIDGRFTMCNMAIEAGAKCGVVGYDETTGAYLRERPAGSRGREAGVELNSDPDAHFVREIEIDAAAVEPTVALPHLPSNTAPGVEPGRRARRPGRDRLVHQRPPRRPAPGRRAAARPHGAPRRAPDHPAGHPAGLPRGGRRRHPAGADRGRRRLQHADLRPLPGGPHGRPGRRRARRVHHQPQLRGPHGPRRQRGLPGEPLRGGGLRDRRPHRHARDGGRRPSRARRGRPIMSDMVFEGTVHAFGRDVDTDVIIPARYLNSSDPAELGAHCMEDIDAAFVERVRPGDIIVAGENFGCGSSREHAPVAIRAAGVSCVVAASFARIFYRNAINTGLPIVVCPAAAAEARAGDRLRVDVERGVVANLTQGTSHQADAFPAFMQELIARGGLLPYVKARLAAGGTA